MDTRMFWAIIAISLATTPAAAQTTTTPASPGSPSGAASPPNTSNAGTANPSTTSPSASPSTNNQGAVGSSEVPSNSVIPSPIEQNRLDSSAPSPNRLLIDPGNAGNAVTNPDVNSSDPNAPGQSVNAIAGVAPSTNGTSTGTSGLGMTPAPSPLSPSMYPQPLTTPPTPNPASNYPAPLTTPTFAQRGITPGFGIGVGVPGAGTGVRSGMQTHSFSSRSSGGHAGGGHR